MYLFILRILVLKVSSCTERAVLDQLLDYFKERLSYYPTTLVEDNYLVLAIPIKLVFTIFLIALPGFLVWQG